MLHARKLRRRAARDTAGEFLLEGPVPVREAIEASVPVTEVFASADAPVEVVSAATGAGIVVQRVSEAVIEAMSDAQTPQGVVAVAPMPGAAIEELFGADLVLVLDEVRDPGNAGTLVRSALAAAAGGIVFGHGSVDPFGPKTVRASAGAILHTKVVRNAPLEDALRALRGDGFTVIGADADADAALDDIDLSGRIALVVGNEARGLSQSSQGSLDGMVRIPLPGPVESLNAAVAGSILLFECVRRRGAGRGPRADHR